MVSGLVKIIYPDGNYTEEDIEEILNMQLKAVEESKSSLRK